MIEDQLREQMHRVDDLTPPPPPDFAGRAMRASSGADARRVEPRDARHRTWGKVLLGAAAAIAVGALAVTTLLHLGGSATTSGASVAGAAAPEDTGGSATTTTSGPELPTKQGGDRPAGVAEPSASAPVTFYDAADCAGTLTAVRAALPALGKQGIQVASAACDARGVVVVRVSPALTPGQRGVLRARYGTRVSVPDLDGRPQP